MHPSSKHLTLWNVSEKCKPPEINTNAIHTSTNCQHWIREKMFRGVNNVNKVEEWPCDTVGDQLELDYDTKNQSRKG